MDEVKNDFGNKNNHHDDHEAYQTLVGRGLQQGRGYGSNLVCTGVRGYDLPAIAELLEVHRGVPYHLLVATREIDGPPS